MSYKEEIEQLLKRMDYQRSLCYKELRRLPVGELHIERSRGYQQFRRYYKRNGKTIRESVSKDPDLIRQLKRRAYFEAEAEILNNNCRLMRKAVSLIEDNDFDNVKKNLKHGLADLDFEDTILSWKEILIPRPTYDTDVPVLELESELEFMDPLDWAVMPYRANSAFIENKCHIGATGLRYRSRAELNVFEHIITERRQPIHYDEVVEINGEMFSPDGIAPSKSGKIILIEYMELDDKEYLRRNARKLEAYHRKGFVLGRNLIILSSESHGFINIPKVDKILDAYLLT